MNCPNPKFVWPAGKIISVPCGKCLFCLENKRNDWSMRLLQEHKYSDGSLFVTLTYAREPVAGVSKRHLQLFFKRLRKAWKKKIRYFAVAEYGSKKGRAHYHILLFGIDDDSVVRRAWCDVHGRPFGIVHVGRVEESSVRYCTKYVVQRTAYTKKERKLGVRDSDGRHIEFSLMSRGYGIGGMYLSDAMIAWHREDERTYMVHYGRKVRLPRFYKDKIWPSSDWSDWKDRREKVGEKGLRYAEEKEANEVRVLKEMGYDPEKIRKEMRDAVANRIKEKVAYTQKF